MIRNLLLAVAALAVSACSYGSAVDMAPMKARLAKPAAAAGDYCEVQGEAAPFTVVSHEDCVPIAWDGAKRTYTMIDPDDQDDSVIAAVVSLGGGLYLAQVDEEKERPDKHQLYLFLSRGDAFAMLPALDDEPLKLLTERHERITFADGRSGRPYIAAGRPDRIKAFLRDAARESLREMKTEDEPLSVGVRDSAGAEDHPANPKQIKDIEAVHKAARSLTR
jgi:hypothetical protein